MTKALMTKGTTALAKLNEVGKEIDAVIETSLPMTMKTAKNFCESLAIARGIADLKDIMLASPEIKVVVEKMANNRLGFLTDRTPATIYKNQKSNKGPQKPYSYEQLVDPIVEGLLKGYRISGNEINIIAGQFYAAKNGNYRRVTEYPGVTGFVYNNAPVELSAGGNVAKIKCWASWKFGSKEMTIGIDKDDECIFQVRVNFGMGEDAVVGKAHAKLFKRCLERITGQIAPESSEVGQGDVFDAEITSEESTPLPDMDKDADRGLDIYGKGTDVTSPEAGTEKKEKPTHSQRYAGSNSQPPDGVTLSGQSKAPTDTPQTKSAEETPERTSEVVTEKRPENGKKPKNGDKPLGTWWHTTTNWVNRRSTPYLYLIRVGLGLPHVDQAVFRPADNEELLMNDISAYQAEIDKFPEAFATLLDSHEVVINKAKDKIAGLGYDPKLWDRWMTEVMEINGTEDPPEVAEEKVANGFERKYNDIVISLPFQASPEIAKAWDKLTKEKPELMAKVVTSMVMPKDNTEAMAALNAIQTTIKNPDGKW